MLRGGGWLTWPNSHIARYASQLADILSVSCVPVSGYRSRDTRVRDRLVRWPAVILSRQPESLCELLPAVLLARLANVYDRLRTADDALVHDITPHGAGFGYARKTVSFGDIS